MSNKPKEENKNIWRKEINCFWFSFFW